MAEPMGFSVRIFIPSGVPEGLRVIEKSNWTGQGLTFPRALFTEVRNRPPLLVGPVQQPSYNSRTNLKTKVLDFVQFGGPDKTELRTFRWEVRL